MFISRKRFEAELEKARCEAAEKMWQERRQTEQFCEIHQRIDQMREDMARIEKKLYVMTEGGNKNA